MRSLPRLAALVVLAMWPAAVYGDGGAMLLHQDAGPFTLTLFAAPQPLHTGDADLSVMVQQGQEGKVILDSQVDVIVLAGGWQQRVHLTTGQASNRLLQAATVHIPKPGRGSITVLVRRGQDAASVSTDCVVEPDRGRARLVWFYILLPLGIVVLFGLHQRGKLRSRM